MEQSDLEAIVQAHSTRIVDVVPGAEVQLSGSACVPALHADDIDLVALVIDVPKAAAVLRALYPPLYEEQWTDDWAAFRSAGPPQVDLVLTRRDSKWDAHHRLAWQVLQTDDALLAEYAALKENTQRYAERKREFFERLAEHIPSKLVR